ncbi:glycoside hydrolase family 73 protein [Latilactobacillus fuchuensis]|uniref:glycoside hydrolase family 73 protein n=1 Tax=Latilactobacillus fuchuensis TaxID=164393 RepID=UPI0039AF067C
MKKRLKGIFLVGIIGLTSVSGQQVLAADNQVNLTSTSSITSSDMSSAQVSDSASGISGTSDGSAIKETEKETSEVPKRSQSNQILKSNAQIGPGFYTVSAPSRMMTRSVSQRTNTQSFLNSVHTGAINGWKKYGVLPSVSAAQAILESGWGQSALATQGNNLFGIKGTYNGQYVTMPTQEYYNGQYVTINAQFRKYPSWNESLEDHGYFLASNARYHNLIGNANYQTVTSLLQQDGYATAPNYSSSLNRIIEQYGLISWDQEINNNKGSMDHLTANEKELHTDGWHAASESANFPYSFLIVINQKTGKEYKRYAINRNQRNDVANAYPNITNAAKSGFSLSVPVTDAMRGNTYKVISRYAQTASGEGSYKDYSFSNTVTVPAVTKQNKASMDSLTANKKTLQISGWHASDDTKGRNYHYLLLMDATTNKEIRRVRVNNVSRKDVQNAYPNIYNSLNSGFNLSTNVDAKLKGKKVYVISRYSATSNADTNYVDYKFGNIVTVPTDQPAVNKNVGSMDQLALKGNQLIINGWHAASKSEGKGYSYLILMNKDNGKEIARYRINRNTRNDVQKAYPDVYGAAQSGFNLTTNVTAKMKGTHVYVISRYAKSASGEGEYVDHSFTNTVAVK